MKKIIPMLVLAVASMMVLSGDLLARGGRAGGGRPGGSRPMDMNRSMELNRPMDMNRSMDLNRPMDLDRPIDLSHPRLDPREPSVKAMRKTFEGYPPRELGKIAPLPIPHPDYRPGLKSGYTHHPYQPYHHHRHYPGWRPGWWTIPVAWGLGAAWWNWNTPDYVYYNPYAVYTQDTTYDYTVPVSTDADESPSDESPSDEEGEEDGTSTVTGAATGTSDQATDAVAMRYFQEAREQFKEQDYTDAMKSIDRAIEKLPNDAALHEFRGLTLFALGRYNRAAAVINSVLASGPGWNWETMIGLYQDPKEYTRQLRNLEKFTSVYETDAAAKFLLAYHYLVMGFTDNAETQLRDVVRLQPKDILSRRLLDMIEASKSQTGTTPVPERPTPQE